MHESAIVADLMRRAESEADGCPERIRRIRLRIGALSGVSSSSLRHGAARYAMEKWGLIPEMEIEESEHLTDVNALGVVLVSIDVGP